VLSIHDLEYLTKSWSGVMEQGTGRTKALSALGRSLFIHSSWNFWRMQNLGFAFAMLPSIRCLAKDREATSRMLSRHLQLFNTNPYMSAPIIGSAMRLEEDLYRDGQCLEVDHLKTTLMAPYAAMGDALFWGSLKPLAAVAAVLLALKGSLFAAVALLVVYNPLPCWIRLKGFAEGYRKGKDGIDFIRGMNLPWISRRIRWLSVLLLGLMAWVVSALPFPAAAAAGHPDVLQKGVMLVAVLGCFWMLRKGVSVLTILYGASLFIMIAAGLL